MSKAFTLSQLTCAIAALSLTSLAGAAGLDRSGQPSAEFSDSGTLAYVSAYHVEADISGVEYNGKVVESVAEGYDGFAYGAKTDVNDMVSVGVFYDQPFGADVYFEGDNSFVNATDPNNVKPTEAKVSSENFTGLIGLNLGNKGNFKVYGGPVLQKLEGTLNVNGDPAVISALDGYDLRIAKNTEYGYMVGAAYLKPEIGLKAAVTYRSAIEHDIIYSESMPLVEDYSLPTTQTKISPLELPQSVNIDFQTGLNPTTLLTAKARWIPWGDFAIVPPLLDSNVKTLAASKGVTIDQAPVLAYTDDTYMLELGIGKRLTPALAVSGSVGWDSGAGNAVSPLGPVEGYYSLGLGAKYNVTPNWALSVGGKYLLLGDAIGELSATKKQVGEFTDNDGYVVGLKLSYQDK